MKARDLKNELRALDVNQLKEKLSQLNLDLFNYRMTAKLGNLEKPSSIQATRRTIAQIKTILSEKAKA